MTLPAIRVNDLGKKYQIGAREKRYATYRDRFAGMISGPLKRFQQLSGRAGADETFWALKDVSFEVRPGEVVGIIGRNGAGKSTLLKILSQITEPTTGRAEINGRVASLLEVGTGFHPELTGRENIFLNGAILGMSRVEIRRKFEEIVDFSGVGRFLDTPIKRYSSGMQMRLAFAVAANLEPEILIIDEVLAVGDAAFQRQCLKKMQNISQQDHRAILFVSHNMVAVQSFCDRCIVLSNGGMSHDGSVQQAIADYLFVSKNDAGIYLWSDKAQAPGTNDVKIVAIVITHPDTRVEAPLSIQLPITIATTFHISSSAPAVHITYHVFTQQGDLAFTIGCSAAVNGTGTYRSTACIPGNLLNTGMHSLKLLIVEDGTRITYQHEGIASFEIIDDRERTSGWMGREPGVVAPVISTITELVNVSPQISSPKAF